MPLKPIPLFPPLPQVLAASDIPEGVVNVLSGSPDHLTRQLATNRDVHAIWWVAGRLLGHLTIVYCFEIRRYGLH